ncbi:phage integrase family protein [Burkholderia ubonensis]|uniref:phage integrase family protein n=1 Tax=Burkholderia ubonensis TaxID=101571 RepID=UPI0007C7E50D|nr:phage integrase family protein [Burkholderia ubonensis]
MEKRQQQLTQPPLRTYSRTEFTALRAGVKCLPSATITRLYFYADSAEPLDVERLLRTMRDNLIWSRALQDGPPTLVAHLPASLPKRRRAAPDARVTAADQAGRRRVGGRGVGRRAPSRPPDLANSRRAARRRRDRDAWCARRALQQRGGSWWHSVPRIGTGRERVLVAWLSRHADTLRAAVDDDTVEPLAAPGPAVEPVHCQLVPLERLTVPHPLSGG